MCLSLTLYQNTTSSYLMIKMIRYLTCLITLYIPFVLINKKCIYTLFSGELSVILVLILSDVPLGLLESCFCTCSS